MMEEFSNPMSMSQAALYRRRKPLPPIKTTFVEDELLHLPRPPPIEATIYQSELAPTPASKRQSRSILGLFNRSKAGKDDLENADLTRRSSSLYSSRSSQDKSKRLSYMRKEKPLPKPQGQPERLVFSMAMAVAIKHSSLAVPMIDTETLLEAQKERQKAIASGEERLDKIHEWRASTFILTRTGMLLQYAANGDPDRLPERQIQLNSDSAAFASDAVPGKHWVLQVTQSFIQEPVVFTARSRFSRISMKPVKNINNTMLLVMDTAEDMGTWLTIVRKEITRQGSETYQPDDCARHVPVDPKKRLQDRPSRRFLIEKALPSIVNDSPISVLSFQSPSDALDSQRQLTACMAIHEELSAYEQEKNGTLNKIKQALKEHRSVLRQLSGESTPPESPVADKTRNSDLLQWELPTDFSSKFSPNSSKFTSRNGSQSQQLGEDLQTRKDLESHLNSQGLPNFSAPSFSERFSQSTRSFTTIPTPPHSSGPSSRRASSPPPPAPLAKNSSGSLRHGPVVVAASSSSNLIEPTNPNYQDFEQDWSEGEDAVRETVKLLPAPPRRASSLLPPTHELVETLSAAQIEPVMEEKAVEEKAVEEKAVEEKAVEDTVLSTQAVIGDDIEQTQPIITPQISTPITEEPTSTTIQEPEKLATSVPRDAFSLRRHSAIASNTTRQHIFELRRYSALESNSKQIAALLPLAPLIAPSMVALPMSAESTRRSSLQLPSQTQTVSGDLLAVPALAVMDSRPQGAQRRRSLYSLETLGPPPCPPPTTPLPAIPGSIPGSRDSFVLVS